VTNLSMIKDVWQCATCRHTCELRVGYTRVWNDVASVASVYHERLLYNLLIPWPSCYGQHAATFSAINWSRLVTLQWSVYGTLFHTRHCVER